MTGATNASTPHYQNTKREPQFRVYKACVIPVPARSKAWVRGRSLAGIAGSNPAGSMDVCVL
jgi:hypothetical protein